MLPPTDEPRSASDAASLRGRAIVIVSSIDWSFLWQGHQEIASRLAVLGNNVLFVENTGVRTIHWSDFGRIVRRLAHLLQQSRRDGREVAPGVTVVAPFLLPFPRSRFARFLNERFLLPRLVRGLRRLGARDPVLFSFLPTPTAVRLVEELATPHSIVVYYCIADFEELSDLGADLQSSEERLARRADLVLVQSEKFGDRLRPFNANIHEVQFGVNLDLFDPSKTTKVPPALAALPRPILGYSGGLHRFVDFELLRDVARAYPAGSLVLVGPLQSPPGELRNEANVHFLGPVGIRALPSLVAAFDVALIPYRLATYTDTVFPTKLYEYLAMGRPVVSTDLPEVRKLGLPPFAVRLAAHGDRFVAVIAEAIRDQDSAMAAQRARLARRRDWRPIVEEIAGLIAEARR